VDGALLLWRRKARSLDIVCMHSVRSTEQPADNNQRQLASLEHVERFRLQCDESPVVDVANAVDENSAEDMSAHKDVLRTTSFDGSVFTDQSSSTSPPIYTADSSPHRKHDVTRPLSITSRSNSDTLPNNVVYRTHEREKRTAQLFCRSLESSLNYWYVLF